MANRNFPNNKLYQFEIMPILLSCNFVVDSTNGNGLGIRNLKGAGIQSIHMHTSATPATGNPNPGAGIILVHFQDQYNRYLSGFSGFVSPSTGSPVTATVNHTTYIIASLGTATLAQWQAVGLPLGVVPAVGAAFTATASATIGGSASVIQPGNSGIMSIEVVGDPNQTIISPSPLMPTSPAGPQVGGRMVLQCLNASDAQAAPANGSVIGLNFYLSNSSVQLNGQ
jgi:hypothetical protein